MATASPAVTITVGKDDKSVELSDRLSLYESPAITFALDNGDIWPSGDYTCALTYYGRIMASAACTNNAGVLTCTLVLATTELESVFAIIRDPRRISFDLTLWDQTAKREWARGRVDVWRTEWTEETASATVINEDYHVGVTAITSGQSSVSVDISSLGLTGAPSQVLVTVQGPSGALNIFGTISGTPTASAFTVSLSAAPDQSGYVVNWVVYP